MPNTKYALLSLPLGVFDSSNKDDAVSALKATVSSDHGSVLPFSIPDFKIGTLDALVQQADDLAKLEQNSEAVVAKVSDSLRSVLDNDPDRLAQYKMVNDSQCSMLCPEAETLLTQLMHRANRPVHHQLQLEQDSLPSRQVAQRDD